MDWLAANWVWVLIGIAFIAMHLFGHGGHGGHDGERHTSGGADDRSERAASDREAQGARSTRRAEKKRVARPRR